MDLDTATADLYELLPGEFTVARDAIAARARKDGDRELATAVKALRRPTVSAWMANWLVRARGDDVGHLLELGAALRAAHDDLDGDRIRELSRRRHQLVAVLVGEARGVVAEFGVTVSDAAVSELQMTLQASLADASAAESLRSGRLSAPLRHDGFSANLPPTADRPRAPAGTSDCARDAEPLEAARADEGGGEIEVEVEVERARRAAERELPAARAAATAAHRAADAARLRTRTALAANDDVVRSIADLDTQLDVLRHRATAAVDEVHAARAAQAEAEQAATQADDRVGSLDREAAHPPGPGPLG